MFGAGPIAALEQTGAYRPVRFTVVRNRPVRSRMQGGVGRVGIRPALIRLVSIWTFI